MTGASSSVAGTRLKEGVADDDISKDMCVLRASITCSLLSLSSLSFYCSLSTGAHTHAHLHLIRRRTLNDSRTQLYVLILLRCILVWLGEKREVRTRFRLNIPVGDVLGHIT